MIARLIAAMARWPLRRPGTVVMLSTIAVAAATVFVPRLHVSTDRNLLAGKDNRSFVHRERVNRLFGTSLAAVVVLEGPDAAPLEKRAGELATRLEARKEWVDRVFYKVDMSFFEKHGLLYLPEGEIRKILDALDRERDTLTLFRDAGSLTGLLDEVGEALAASPPGEDTSQGREEEVKTLGALFDDMARWFYDEKETRLTFLDPDRDYRPPGIPSPLKGEYLAERDGRSPFVRILFVQPRSNSQSMEAVEPLTMLLRTEAAAAVRDLPGARAYVTGMPAIVTDEMNAVSRDCVVAGFIAGVGVLFIFIIAFHSIRVSLFAVIPLGVGLILSAGLAGALFGHLTLITSYFAAVLFGLGVDFSIHLLARFHEALRAGESKSDAVRIALTRAGPAVVVGAGTTMFAFLAVGFSDFKGFAEMGIISGGGVFLILLANLFLLPAALLLWHPGMSVVRKIRPPLITRHGIWALLYKPKWSWIVLTSAGCVAGSIAAFGVGFDYAVENLLPGHADSVEGMKILNERTDFSMNYSIALADSVQGAKELRRKFETLETVARAEDISMFIPDGQETRLALLKENADLVSLVAKTETALAKKLSTPSLVTARDIAMRLGAVSETLGRTARDPGMRSHPEAKAFRALYRDIDKARRAVMVSGDDTRAAALERTIFSTVHHRLHRLSALLHEKGIAPDDLSRNIRDRYVSKDGRHFAVFVFPSGDIGEKDFFERHVAELLSVSPQTTGHPVTHLEFTHMVHRGFRDAFILSALAVLLLILVDLRDWRSLTLALIPVLVGISSTLLVMWLIDLRFNYANLMALPILIGTGVDYGAHMAHRAKQEGSIDEAARTTGRAIALTGLTTLVGFGALLFGQHWGVRSLGLILVLGIGFSLLAALVVIPAAVRKRNPKVS